MSWSIAERICYQRILQCAENISNGSFKIGIDGFAYVVDI